MKIVAAKKILKANDRLAAENRNAWNASGIFGVNLVGSPGCGKTTLIEAMLAQLGGRLGPAVIEGDIAGSIDAERIEKMGVPVVQINTEGACHLDAMMISAACQSLDMGGVNLLLIENVGNLVCTAGFDLGEHLRLVVLSTTEGTAATHLLDKARPIFASSAAARRPPAAPLPEPAAAAGQWPEITHDNQWEAAVDSVLAAPI